MSYKDRDDPGNGPKYHTGRPCIEVDCDRPAGTMWSALWCFECNVERINRIDKSLETMLSEFEKGGKE